MVLARFAVCIPVLTAVCTAAFGLVEQSATSVGQYQKLELTIPYLSFSDVPWDQWAFGYVEWCRDQDIVEGYGDGTYRPQEVVTRAQMAVYIARSLAGGDAYVPPGPGVATFPDVPTDHWAFRHVQYCVSQGVVAGYPDNTYRPDAELDRGQMAVFIARAMCGGEGGVPDPACDVPPFPDVPCDHWARRYVQFIQGAGVASGYPDGTYRPAALCTRDQMAVYVARGRSVPGGYDNLYHPAQVNVVAVFTTPSAGTVEVPGFYYRPYTRMGGSGWESLTQDGAGLFKIRSAWPEVGDYTYQVLSRSVRGDQVLGVGAFSVTASGDPGYVRRSATAPLYLQFDSGAPYFAIGENMCWPQGGGTYDYDVWMPNLASHGGNYLRLWLINEWNMLGLEHLSLAPNDGNGLGRYDQKAAWRIDYILDLAQQLGVKVMMCVDSFNSVDATGIYGQWNRSPYNSANGGPCANPWDFFTDAQAKALFEQRLRYLVARYGYQTSVLSWEFWNEVDLATGYDSASVAAWHQQMGQYLRARDPWAHLITTSFANTDGDPAVDALPELDYVQSHNYGSHDMAATISMYCRQKVEDYGKPHYFGEFGTDWQGTGNPSDLEGIHLHNGLWSAMLSRSAGTAMLWWWDSYVEPYHLYGVFAPVAAFAADVNWPDENYDYATVAGVQFVPGHEPSSYPEILIEPPCESWQDGSPCNQPHSYQVSSDGTVSNLDVMSRVQHGLINHPAWHNPATFQVNYPAAGRFEVMVWAVSGYGGAGLTISLDGSPALARDFPDLLPGDYETMHQYDGAYGIDVPAGPHTIAVENPGTDWCYVSYRLTNYLTSPNLRVLALSNPTSALVWVQNRMHTWWNHSEGHEPDPVNASEITLAGLTPGTYAVEQWDTYAGTATALPDYVSADGTVVLTTPDGLTTDLAYKVRRR
jgi:hypothetical protein